MPVLEPSDPVFASVPTRFESPFPSSDANASLKFAGLAGDNGPILAAAQADAWQTAVRVCMKSLATSTASGGFRQQWLEELTVPQAGLGGTTFWGGLFAEVAFQPSTNENSLLENMGGAAFDKAINFISARTGVYGQILKASVTMGKFFYNLMTKEESEQLQTVPWQEYSRDTDEDLINRILEPMMATVDWTSLFSPPLEWRRGFKLAKTEHGDETRAFGVWGSGSHPEPEYASGWGFQPGTQQMAEVVQLVDTSPSGSLKPRDIITNIGTFYPSTCQYATAAENFINRAGSADMYKIQPSLLEQQWKDYYYSFFYDGFAQLRSIKSAGHERSARLLAKAIWQGIFRTDPQPLPYEHFPAYEPDNPMMSGNVASFTKAELFTNPVSLGFRAGTTFEPVSTAAIAPALKTLRQRQMSCLAHSLACAYVRPYDLPGLPAFAAFKDPGPPEDPKFRTWGEELTARCLAMRKLFLRHLDRYKARTADVRNVDPRFADELAASKRLAPELPIKGRAPFEPLDPDASEPDASPGPKGGPPGKLVAIEVEPPWLSLETKVAVGTLAVAGGLGYAGHRVHQAQQ